jgi:peptidoglycan biosynthesis protein MviN/MurJ (putative lipid II flippase)
MRAEGSPGRETRFALLAAALNIALTVPLLLALGPAGVPLASAAAWTLSSLWFFRSFHRTTGRPVGRLARELWKPFAAAAAGASFTFAALGMRPETSGRMGAGAEAGLRAALVLTLTAGALLLLRFIDEDDRALVRRVLAGMRPSAAGPRPRSLRAERT